jgi:hypothetical protein
MNIDYLFRKKTAPVLLMNIDYLFPDYKIVNFLGNVSLSSNGICQSILSNDSQLRDYKL